MERRNTGTFAKYDPKVGYVRHAGTWRSILQMDRRRRFFFLFFFCDALHGSRKYIKKASSVFPFIIFFPYPPMASNRTTPRIILGTQSFALETTDPTKSDFRVQGAENLKPFLSCLERYGVHELDTARVYCEGDTETVLGQVLGSPSSPFKPFEISTKVYPIEAGDHGPEALTRHLYRSLEQLKRDKVKIFYLHAPDFYTPFEVTLKAIDEVYKKGLFEEFGLSNFASWQVAAIYQICHFKGYVKPTVYQGWYNPLMRQLEREVFPCLKELGIRFYAYNPIAGGFLTGKYALDSEVPDGSRFDTKTLLGPYYREQYWSPLYFDAVRDLKTQAVQHNIPLLEASIRWLNHHSGLGPSDGLIFGANDRVQDLEENLQSLQKGPLPSELVKAFEDCWDKTKAGYQTYFRRDIREKTPPKNGPEGESVASSSSREE